MDCTYSLSHFHKLIRKDFHNSSFCSIENLSILNWSGLAHAVDVMEARHAANQSLPYNTTMNHSSLAQRAILAPKKFPALHESQIFAPRMTEHLPLINNNTSFSLVHHRKHRNFHRHRETWSALEHFLALSISFSLLFRQSHACS